MLIKFKKIGNGNYFKAIKYKRIERKVTLRDH